MSLHPIDEQSDPETPVRYFQLTACNPGGVAYANGKKVSVGEARKLKSGDAAPAPIASNTGMKKSKPGKIKKRPWSQLEG